MDKKDIQIYEDRYNKRLEQYGYDAKTLGWGGGKEKQFTRFKALCEIGVNDDDSIIDLGCGFADLYEFLQQTGWKGKYTGIDINDSLLAVARNNHPGIHVEKVDILDSAILLNADWVVSSGVFNAKLHFTSNIDHIRQMLTSMYAICNKGVAVDFLSVFVDFRHPDAYHAEPMDIIKISKELSNSIVLRMDYLLYEYCVYIKKI